MTNTWQPTHRPYLQRLAQGDHYASVFAPIGDDLAPLWEWEVAATDAPRVTITHGTAATESSAKAAAEKALRRVAAKAVG